MEFGRDRLVSLLRATAGVALVGLLLWRADLSQLSLVWDRRAIVGLLSAIALLAGALWLSAVRWRLVLGDTAPALATLGRIYLIGWFFSLFLPTSVGGDAVRALAVARGRASAGEALSSIVLERLLGLLALAVLLVAGCLLAPAIVTGALDGAGLALSGWSLAAAAGVGALLLWIALRVGRRVPRIMAAARDAAALWSRFRRSPSRLGSAFAVSLLVQATYIAVWYDLSWSLRLEVPFLAFLVFVPLVSLAAMLPVTLSGLGVREGVWVLLLARFGVPAANAVGFSLAYYGAGLALGVVGGALFARSGMRVPEPARSPGPEVLRPAAPPPAARV